MTIASAEPNGPPASGLRVCAFESRKGLEMRCLLERQGMSATIAPSMREVPLEENPDAFAFADRLFAGTIDIVILLTGVGTRALAEVLATRHDPGEFLTALQKCTIIVRGPKPAAVLREWKVRIDHQVPARSLDFPMNLIVNIIPTAATPGVRPSPEDRVAYGKYLVTAASCGECHTKSDDRGQKLPGMDFAGGFQFAGEQGYRVRSANITPDADSGIGQWTEEQFVNKFKAFEAPDDHVLTDAEQRQNTAMPWKQYAGMTREDLGTIYTYLRTLKPVLNRVDKFPDSHPTAQ